MQKFYVNVTRLGTQLNVPSVRLYFRMCHVSPATSAKRFCTTSKTPVGHRPVSRPFQLVAIKLIEYEAYEGFSLHF